MHPHLLPFPVSPNTQVSKVPTIALHNHALVNNMVNLHAVLCCHDAVLSAQVVGAAEGSPLLMVGFVVAVGFFECEDGEEERERE